MSPAELRTLEVLERARAQARQDYALGRLSAQATPVQQWRANLAAMNREVAPPPDPPFEAQTVVYAPAREHWVPARAPMPFARPILTESPVPMTPVQEDHQPDVRTPSPAPSGGLVARMVEVVSLRRSTRAKRPPQRFDEVEFPKGRRT